MKTKLLLIILFFYVNILLAQKTKNEINDFSIENFDKLVKSGRFVLVENFKDFRYSKCADSIAKTLGFEIQEDPTTGNCTTEIEYEKKVNQFRLFMKTEIENKLEEIGEDNLILR